MIRWSETAADHLEAIWLYVAEKSNAGAANATVARLIEGVLQLKEFPHMGRSGRSPDTRELVIAPYIVVYHLRAGAVLIDAVLHGSRRY